MFESIYISKDRGWLADGLRVFKSIFTTGLMGSCHSEREMISFPGCKMVKLGRVPLGTGKMCVSKFSKRRAFHSHVPLETIRKWNHLLI